MAKVLLNALHTSGGGGLVFLNGILPHLQVEEWLLLVSPEAVGKVAVPEGMAVKVAPRLGFFGKHGYEQVMLPVLQRMWGCRKIVCNANYGPLLARGLVPIIHTTPRAAYVARGVKMRAYWSLLKLLTRLSLARAAKVVTVAAHVLPDYGGRWLAAKAVVAHPGRPVWTGAKVEKDDNLLVAVGDVYAQKQYPVLVAAFASLLLERPGTRLEIIGRPVDKDAVAVLEHALDSHGVRAAVKVVPGMPHADLLRRLAAARVLVSASKAECFNLPLLEAMTVGTVVVCGDFAFQREVVGHAALLAKMDGAGAADALAAAVLGVLADKARHNQLAEDGLVRARQFDWAATAKVIAGAAA